MLRPITERLLHNARIDAGMRVLGVDPLYGSLAELLQTLQPQLERMGIMTAETIVMEWLESRLRDAVIEARSQIYGPA